jgi:hypothetical protein
MNGRNDIATAIASDSPRPASINRAVWLSVAVSLTVAATFTWALSAAAFLIGVSIGRWQSICGLVAAALVLLRLNRDVAARALSALCFVLVITGSVCVSAITIDNSYDGWSYHQPGVIALSHGWNPVAEPVVGDWWARHASALGYPAGAPRVDILWTTVYPKAMWILGAQAIVWGLPLDAGKYAALLLIFIAGVTAFRALQLRGVPRYYAYALAVLAAVNPVAVTQATSYYIDGPLGSCLAILIFSLLSFDLTRSRLDLLLALCAVLIACNLKFTGPVYTVLTVFPIVLWWLLKHRITYQHALIAGAAALFLVAGSINPYLTNLRVFGSPIYPLNRTDVMEDQMSAEFLKENRFEKLFVSLTFSNLADHFAGAPERDESNLTSPFQARCIEELRRFVGVGDLRFGGFGPFFGVVLALALAASGFIARGLRDDIAYCLVAAGVLLSIVANPEMWWARYVPQMWLLPVLIAAYAPRIRIASSFALMIALLMGITSVIAVVGRAVTIATATKSYEKNLAAIGDAPLRLDPALNEVIFLPALSYRLHERGATSQWIGGQCEHPIVLVMINGCKGEHQGK